MPNLFKAPFRQLLHMQSRQLINSTYSFPTLRTRTEEMLDLIHRLAPRKTREPLIRVGPHGDGGYLVPNDFEGVYALFSPGVSSISGFEKECASMGLKVFMADKSVDRPAEEDPNFEFTKKYIGCVEDDDFMTLDSWIAAALPQGCTDDLVLQMDIEGAEYESIISITNGHLRRFRLIVVEFHFLDQLWSRPFFDVASRAFAKLLQFHTCVHIHPNNCCGSVDLDGIVIPRFAEFTFLRNDRGVLPGYVESLPHPLDVDCTAKPTLSLHPVWLGSDQGQGLSALASLWYVQQDAARPLRDLFELCKELSQKVSICRNVRNSKAGDLLQERTGNWALLSFIGRT